MANEKKYDFVSATRVGESIGNIGGKEVFGAVATVIGFVTKEPIVRKTNDGNQITEITLALNNTGKKMTGSLGLEAPAEEVLWLKAVAFDSGNFELATRLEKAIKKGMRVALNGFVKVTEYEGRPQYQMTINDFDIIWSSEKGNSYNSNYTWLSSRKANKEGQAVVAFRAKIAKEPEVKVTPNNKEVMTFSVPLSKIGKKLNYALGIDGKSDETTWLQVNVWNNEGFKLKDRAEKILHKGSVIVGQGIVSTSTGEDGKVFYSMNLNDFEVTSNGNKKTESGEQSTPETEPVFNGTPIDILDDDLPF